MRGVSDDREAGTAYLLQAADGSSPRQVAEVPGSWQLDRGKERPPARPGVPVQGRPTYVFSAEGGPGLWVDEIRPGVSVMISGTAPGGTLDELYRIAAGIRWNG